MRILGCHADLLLMFQKFCRRLWSADTHPAFSESKIQNFIQFPLFFQDGIFAYDTDISRTVFDISRHIRSFCKKETQFQLFIDKDQFSGIFILHLLAGDPNFLKQLQCFLCEPSFSQCKCQISHAFSSCGFTVCTFPSAAK